jgi:ABC-2 type transport system ATP-binding protein
LVFGGERGLYWRLSGRDNLQYFADIYKVPPEVSKRHIPELLEMVGLTDRANERIEGYSRGMKQRLHIARGLIHDPELLFLDEPTIGLDPLAARDLRELIRGLNKAGKTIFLTSHYMFEIDALCDRVAIMSKGKILVLDTPSALKKNVANLEVVEIECFGIPDRLIAKLRAHPSVQAVNIEPLDQSQLVQIQAPAGAELVKEFLGILEGVQVHKVVTRLPTLEDAYVRLVGEESKKV